MKFYLTALFVLLICACSPAPEPKKSLLDSPTYLQQLRCVDAHQPQQAGSPAPQSCQQDSDCQACGDGWRCTENSCHNHTDSPVALMPMAARPVAPLQHPAKDLNTNLTHPGCYPQVACQGQPLAGVSSAEACRAQGGHSFQDTYTCVSLQPAGN